MSCILDAMHIGIFDSGLGGQFVGMRLRRLVPECQYDVVDDRVHAPYGERSYEDIARLTEAAIQPLLTNCRIIVIACNTATAAAITLLRAKYPDHSFIGFEPMIKQAALVSKTRHITLLSTYATAHSERTDNLIRDFAPDFQIDMPSTRGWAAAIDQNEVDAIGLAETIQSVAAGSDTIIIGCTHYIALEQRLRDLSPRVTILEPTEAVARQLRSVINSLPPR